MAEPINPIENPKPQLDGCADPNAINYKEVEGGYQVIGWDESDSVVETYIIDPLTGSEQVDDNGAPILYVIVEGSPSMCRYNEVIEGCMDRMATNYNPIATQSCSNCCTYNKAVTTTLDVTKVGPVTTTTVTTTAVTSSPECSIIGVSTVNYNGTQILVDINGVDLDKTCCQSLAKTHSMSWVYDDTTKKCYINTDYQGIDPTTNNSCLPVTFSLNERPMSVTCGNPIKINLWLYVGEPKDDECYKQETPILARIKLTNSTLNGILTQTVGYNSGVDKFNNWVKLQATLPATSVTMDFGVDVEFYQGLECCCTYDIFIDNIEVLCNGEVQQSVNRLSGLECPGFKLTKVIDNKKSWVYNPGIPEVGISNYDTIERADGSFGLLNGEGTINRTFAPSLDADIPWRYTDYWNQSSVLEKHSNLVLNSKELELTFDMCADCPISGTSLTCPDGYTLSGGTTVCYNMTGTTSATSVTTLTYLSLYNLENYKKQFQSFWIPFMEQFIPATTIWVAGERWCNEPCTIIDPCDYDFELVDSEISVEPTPIIKIRNIKTEYSLNILPSQLVNLKSTNVESISKAEEIINPPNILEIRDIGLIIENPLFKTFDELNIINKMEQYRSKFKAVQRLKEIV